MFHRTLNDCIFKTTLVALHFCIALISNGNSAETLVSNVAHPVALRHGTARLVIQSEDIAVPKDFMAKSENGKLSVSLASLGIANKRAVRSSLLVILLDEEGEEKKATTDENGFAQFVGVQPNKLHALLVADDEFHGAIPVMPVSLAKAKDLDVVSDTVAMQLIDADPKEILVSFASNIPPPASFAGEVAQIEQYDPREESIYRVRLLPDGSLPGKVIVLDRDLPNDQRYAVVAVYQNKNIISRTTSELVDGGFSLPSLKPGYYGVIASGPAGYSSFGFEVLPALNEKLPPVLGNDGTRPVSFQTKPLGAQFNAASKLSVLLVPPKFLPKVGEKITKAYSKSGAIDEGTAKVSGAGTTNGAAGSSSIGTAGTGSGGFRSAGAGIGGGFGGGGFYGGGGGGGPLGLGPIGGLIGAAIIASAAGTNDDQAPVVSRIVP